MAAVMSAKGAASQTRLRKAVCADCGYTIRVARSWLKVGLPSCPCGGTIEPADEADLLSLGIIAEDDVSRRALTEIARANGWSGMIRPTSKMKLAEASQLRRAAPAETCAYAGCGLWVKAGAVECAHGHSQTGELVEAMPF